jgi:hypothetical protein
MNIDDITRNLMIDLSKSRKSLIEHDWLIFLIVDFVYLRQTTVNLFTKEILHQSQRNRKNLAALSKYNQFIHFSTSFFWYLSNLAAFNTANSDALQDFFVRHSISIRQKCDKIHFHRNAWRCTIFDQDLRRDFSSWYQSRCESVKQKYKERFLWWCFLWNVYLWSEKHFDESNREDES